ncbi:MAG: discoidin domain-containing protein [Verrucomicrobia bacterium]|nr:discoidin domain-containing protein [Verrucomicrobiota bacterium]
MWLNRDGSLPTLTSNLYARLLGPNATVEERRQYYARTLAAKTEFWRAKRKCAGVLHFCGLGYCRPDGQTSDNFTDVQNLVFEPNFFRYVRDSFAPVGVMLDFWGTEATAGEKKNLRVAVINDLDAVWSGTVRLRLLKGATVLAEQTKPLTIPALGEAEVHFELIPPSVTADCTLEAALVKKGEPPVCSLRDVHIEPRRPNLALGRPAKASSEARNELGFFPAQLAVDGKGDTRWSSRFGDDGWLAVDLGAGKTVSGVELVWEAAFAAAYVIETSADGTEWKEVARNPNGNGGTEQLKFAPVTTQWIRIRALKRATGFGISLWEFRVTGEDAATQTKKNL